MHKTSINWQLITKKVTIYLLKSPKVKTIKNQTNGKILWDF